jgi:hypothetical protein
VHGRCGSAGRWRTGAATALSVRTGNQGHPETASAAPDIALGSVYRRWAVTNTRLSPGLNQETCSVASTADTMLENMDYYILRKIARHIGNSSIACRTGDCPASCRKIQRQPQESRDLIGCLPTLTPIIHPTSGGLTLCELIKRYKEDPSRRSLTDKTRDT